MTYDYADADGNYTDPAIRTVFVVDTLPPEIILEGGDFITFARWVNPTKIQVSKDQSTDGEVVVLSSEKSRSGTTYHYVYFQTPFNEDFVNLESDIGIQNDQLKLGTHYLGAGPEGRFIFLQEMQSFGAIHTLIKMITSRIYSLDISMLHEMGITHS